jgi:hypothetical protein
MYRDVRVDEVFGISVQYRPISYVDRGHLDTEISTYLKRDLHIALRGASKCGKSWLRQKTIDNPLIVQCRIGKSIEDLYIDALSQLNIKLELDLSRKGSFKGKVTAQGTLGARILSGLGVSGELGYDRENTAQTKVVGHDIQDLRFIADIIKASGKRLVIEDFHYTSGDERKRLAFDLKTLWDYGLFVIIVGIWSQSNMLISLNPDLTGRVHELPITWSRPELEAVLEKGGNALSLSFSEKVKNAIIDNSYGIVGILQKIALETLDRAGIRIRPGKRIEFDEMHHMETAAMFYAEQLNERYQQFARRVAGGIRKRKESTGIYAHAMAVIMDANDGFLIDGLNLDVIYEIAKKRQSRIHKHNLRVVLEKIEELQIDEDGRGLVLAFNANTADITAVDRQLLLYRKFSTVQWPWEDLIREIESAESVS